MIEKCVVETISNEEVMFIYLNFDYEFGSSFNSKNLKKEIENGIRKNNFKGKKILFVVSGIIVGTLLINKPVYNNYDFKYVDTTIINKIIEIDKNDINNNFNQNDMDYNNNYEQEKKKSVVSINNDNISNIKEEKVVENQDNLNNDVIQNNTNNNITAKESEDEKKNDVNSEIRVEEDVKEDDEKYEINSDTQGKAKEGTYAKLFNKETIQDVKISIDENNWNYLLQNAIDKPTVLASSVSIGDDTVKYVGIKTKGNLTLKEVWNSSSDRFSFTINFGKYINTNNGYIDKQNLYGLRKVALNNIYGDATLMKEYLSYELMTKMGIPTPEYSLINLYINDEFYGVYMMVESIDSSLTQRTLGEKSDYLVKPESSGGDLIYDNSLDEYINDDGEFDFSSIIYDNSENIIYPNDKSNPLYKYNGLWKNDEDTFEDIVDMLPTIFKWMKTLNELNNTNNPNTDDYKLALEEIIDVDSLIRYFAVNTYLVNLDSYQSEKMQNYALYINETGRATIIPWDYNYSFGVYGLGSASDVINFDIYNPAINTTLKDRPLLNVILQNDEYKTLYEKYLNDITIIASEGGTTSDGDTYEENNFATILNKYNKLLNNIYENDPTAFYTLDEYNKATTSLKELIEQRSEAVLNQLNGNNEKVTTDINLRDMGESVGGIGNDFQDKRA